MVFSEVMGVIQGSEEALESRKRYLDQNTYENPKDRSRFTCSEQRSPIYAIFELYLKLKQKDGRRDAADRTHSILNNMSERGVPRMIDYLYVDEVQDNLLIDNWLLRLLCRNPHGLFWAGDTAQTISVGSSFRFQDLKAFLYRIEEKRCSAEHRTSSLVKPKSFQLAVC